MADMATWAQRTGSRVHALDIPPPSSPSTFSLSLHIAHLFKFNVFILAC